ncbi:MAG: hypothetical protein ACRDHE_18465, partial [Ktedonobacterales bacterium]
MAALLNSSQAVSPWGKAAPGDGGPGPAFVGDIAADGGTDPRALSWAAYTITPGGYYFHNWIYATGANFPGNQTATYDFGSDFGSYRGLNDPMSVTVKYGKHSFVIGGVWASSAAVAQLSSERHLSLMAGQQPALIFLPIDPRVRDPTSPVHSWTGGGAAAMDPMWLVQGSNGLNYFVGPDLRTHLLISRRQTKPSSRIV